MKIIKEIANEIMDKIMNVVKKWGTCTECGEKIPPELCSAYEEFLLAEQLNVKEFEVSLKVEGSVQPDFDEYFGWTEVQHAYTDWAFSTRSLSLMEVCDQHIPFERGTPEYSKAAGMIQLEIDRGIQRMRKNRRAEESLLICEWRDA